MLNLENVSFPSDFLFCIYSVIAINENYRICKENYTI